MLEIRDLGVTDSGPRLAELRRRFAQWVDGTTRLREFVSVDLPIDVGTDFLVMPFRIRGLSTDTLDEGEDVDDAQREEWLEMSRTARVALGQSPPDDELIVLLAEKLLCQPSRGTMVAVGFEDPGPPTFRVVDLEIDDEDLPRVASWLADLELPEGE